MKDLLAEMRKLLCDLEGKEDLEISLDVLEAEIKKEKSARSCYSRNVIQFYSCKVNGTLSKKNGCVLSNQIMFEE